MQSIEDRIYQANSSLKRERFRESLPIFLDILSYHGYRDFGCLYAGHTYRRLGNFKDGEDFLRQVDAMSKYHTSARYELGMLRYDQGRYDEAILIHKKILHGNQGNIEIMTALAMSYYEKKDYYNCERQSQAVIDQGVRLIKPEGWLFNTNRNERQSQIIKNTNDIINLALSYRYLRRSQFAQKKKWNGLKTLWRGLKEVYRKRIIHRIARMNPN